jgi:hypothetical protein
MTFVIAQFVRASWDIDDIGIYRHHAWQRTLSAPTPNRVKGARR